MAPSSRTPLVTLILLGALATPVCAQDEEPAAGTDTLGTDTLPVPLLVGDRSSEGRKRVLGKFGGNSATERSVEAGLAWLARHAEEGGGWDADGFSAHCEEGSAECSGVGKGQHGEDVPCPFDTGVSALATMAFLGHGHLPDAEGDPYGKLVGDSLRRLQGAGGSWGLVLATQALAEAEAMERQGRWKDTVIRNAERFVAGRGDDGAWGYASGFRPGSDVPFTALVVQALVTARDAGATLPDDMASRMDNYLDGLEVKKGRLAYLKQGRRYGYTPTTSNAHCGAAIRQLLHVGLRGTKHRAHMALIAKQKPKWKISFRKVKVKGRGEVQVQVGNLSMYQWWYGTVATFHAGGGSWTGYFGRVKGALVGHQEKTACARGSWDPKGTYERQTGGRVFATSLGVLMLEQPYRHKRIVR